MTVSIDLARLEVKPALARVVDLLRADDDDLRAVELLRELRRLQAQAARRASGRRDSGTRAAANFLRAVRSGRNVSSIRAPSLPPCSTTAKLAAAPGMSAAMPIGVIDGSAPTAGRIVDLGRLRQPLGELDAHLEAHGVDEEVGDGLGLLGDDFAEDPRLVQRAGDGPAGLHERLGEAVGHRLAASS